MSDWAQIIVDIEVSAERASELADVVRAWLVAERIIEQEESDSVLLGMGHRPGINYRVAIEKDDKLFLSLMTNGVAFEAGRQVFDPGGYGMELRCDACGVSFDPDHSWVTAVDAWFYGDDMASFPCPSCGRHTPLTEWRGPCPCGFGNLGLSFWNWPPLSDSFIDALTRKLGHRTIMVKQRL